MKRFFKKFLPNKNHGKITMIVGIILLILGITLFVYTRVHSKSDKSNSGGEQVITYSTNKPNESKKDANGYDWKGTANEPKKIRISSLGVDAFIQKSGIDQNRQIAVPNNVHLASWFVEGVKPGQSGLSIIDGHVSGKTSDGVFKNLSKLNADDSIQIEYGDGALFNFKVVEVVELKESESADYLYSQKPEIESQLNLITCGGTFNKTENKFENRVIVAARRVI